MLEGVDGLNEPAVRLGLAADRGVGDLSALRRRYDRFARRLKDDIDAEPAPETQALLRGLGPARAAGRAGRGRPERGPGVELWSWLAVGLAAVVLVVLGVLALDALVGAATARIRSRCCRSRRLGARSATPTFGAGVSEAVLDLLAPRPSS